MTIDREQSLDAGHDPEHGSRTMHLRQHRPLPDAVALRVSYVLDRSLTAGSAPTDPVPSGRLSGHPLLTHDLEVRLPEADVAAWRARVGQLPASHGDPLAYAAHLCTALGLSGAGGIREHSQGDQRALVERFVDLCRLARVPARLVSGLRLLPGLSAAGPGQHAAGVHFWAELFVSDRGWIAADPLCGAGGPADLFTLGLDHLSRTRGGNVLLQPAQRGPRLRAFCRPYAEVDGRPHPVHHQVRVSVLETDASRMDGPAGPPPAGEVGELGSLLAEELAVLSPPPGRIRLGRGGVLPPAGAGEWLYVLSRGCLRLSRLTVSGRRLELAVLTAPALFQADRVRRGIAEALEECELRALRRDQVRRIARRRPDFGFCVLEALGERPIESEDRLEYLACHGVPARLALALLRQRGQDGLVANVTHQQLGDVVGASRETVTKVLGQLQAEGCVRVSHRRVTVLDPEALARLLER